MKPESSNSRANHGRGTTWVYGWLEHNRFDICLEDAGRKVLEKTYLLYLWALKRHMIMSPDQSSGRVSESWEYLSTSSAKFKCCITIAKVVFMLEMDTLNGLTLPREYIQAVLSPLLLRAVMDTILKDLKKVGTGELQALVFVYTVAIRDVTEKGIQSQVNRWKFKFENKFIWTLT